MKLLLFTNLFPTPSDPERGVFTLQIARQFQKHTQLTVVCPLPYFPKLGIFKRFKKWHELAQVPSAYQIEDISVLSPKYLLIPRLSERFHDSLMAMSLTRFMHKLHRQHKFDIVNSKWLYPDACAADALFRNSGIPHVTAGLGSDINYQLKNNSKRKKILHMLSNADAAIVVSSSLKDALIEAGAQANKITVIHNGVDTSQFKPSDQTLSRIKLAVPQNVKSIVFVGRLSEEKGIATLIHAMHDIVAANQIDQPHLYIIGDGPLRAALQQLIDSLRLNSNISLVGKIAHTDVSTWLGACDVFCLPSFNEGCPNVVLEALGSGRPVVASSVGAIPDIVTSKTGILFTAGNVKELSSALVNALNKKWDTQEIVSSIDKLSWQETAARYMAIFRDAIHKKNNKVNE